MIIDLASVYRLKLKLTIRTYTSRREKGVELEGSTADPYRPGGSAPPKHLNPPPAFRIPFLFLRIRDPLLKGNCSR